MRLTLPKPRKQSAGAGASSIGFNFASRRFVQRRQRRHIQIGIILMLVAGLTWMGLSWFQMRVELEDINSVVGTLNSEIAVLNSKIAEASGGQTLDQMRGRVMEIDRLVETMWAGELDYRRIVKDISSISDDHAWVSSISVDSSADNTARVSFVGQAVEYLDVESWRQRLIGLGYFTDVPLLATYSGVPGQPQGGLTWKLGPVTINNPYTDRRAIMGIPASPVQRPGGPAVPGAAAPAENGEGS